MSAQGDDYSQTQRNSVTQQEKMIREVPRICGSGTHCLITVSVPFLMGSPVIVIESWTIGTQLAIASAEASKSNRKGYFAIWFLGGWESWSSSGPITVLREGGEFGMMACDKYWMGELTMPRQTPHQTPRGLFSPSKHIPLEWNAA